MLLSSSHFFAHNDATLSYKQAARFYQCAWYVDRLYLKNMLHLLKGRNWTVLKQYLLHMATDLYVKDWIWKVTLCFLSVWILYILKDSLKAGLYCTLVTELLLKVMLHFPGESVFFENGWRFFQTVCLNSVWSDNCFPQRTLHSCARIIA